MNAPFTLDKANGKLMGVCAGLARTTGADATLIRLLAIAALLVAGPAALLFYLVAALVAPAAQG
jgi:phage shock protein PspC (stress-responsive transcriptional regulator)